MLLSDREAEHLPGCNMAFRRTALERLGGFDPQFRVAGDDVDICWRLLEAGHRLGFSPAAVVWHSRRPSVRAYLRQQRGYGAAEALLERKWPQRYGPDGQARWRGRLYGRGLVSGISRARVYYGTWGTEPFQALYGGPRGRLATLGSLPEWHLALLALAGASVAALWWAPLLVALSVLAVALVAWVAPGALDAARARFMHERVPRRRKLKMWTLTTLLYLAQPLARLRGRMRTPPWRPVKPPRAACPAAAHGRRSGARNGARPRTVSRTSSAPRAPTARPSSAAAPGTAGTCTCAEACWAEPGCGWGSRSTAAGASSCA